MQTSFDKISPVVLVLLLLVSCDNSRQEETAKPILQTASSLQYNAACQTDTLRFITSGAWTADCDAGWITLTDTEGEGNGTVELYIQQNDDEAPRQGTVRIHTAGGDLTVPVSQEYSPNNGNILVNLPKTFGLGWGYDASIDYADEAGIRGQIFDAGKLKKDYGNEAFVMENSTSTHMFYEKAESSETLQQKIGGHISAEVDIKIASAKITGEFSQQITEQKDRLYVWCRDIRTVKLAYLGNCVDLYDGEMLKMCTTDSFRKSVNKDNAQDIVRKFGTHLITSSTLGGKLDYYFTVSQAVKTTVEKLVATINVKILFIKTSTSIVDENTWTEIKKDFKGSFIVTGGGQAGMLLNQELKKYASAGQPLTDSKLFDNWYQCFEVSDKTRDEDMAMVDFTVIPIWDIIYELNPAKAEAVEDYVTNTYLQ